MVQLPVLRRAPHWRYERRQAERLPAREETYCTVVNHEAHSVSEAVVLNLSATGICLGLDDRLLAGQALTVELENPILGTWRSKGCLVYGGIPLPRTSADAWICGMEFADPLPDSELSWFT